MHVITDNDLFQRLAFDNPWWSFTETTKITFRHPPKRVFFPAFVEALGAATGDGRALALAGPLRAGKTVMLRQTVAHLVERGVSARAIFYCNLTNPSYTAADLATLFEMFCRRYRHGPEAELYVFFDEIQYVKEWQQAILRLAEMRPKARIVAAMSSGSPSIVQGETAAEGRIGVFVLPPLTFLEFLRFRHSEDALFGAGAERRGSMTLAPEALPALNQEFARYVTFGGFLEAVAGSAKNAPAPTFIRDGVADRVLHKDLASLAGINDPQELNRLFGLLAFNTAREVTLDDLAKATGTAKNTLRKYLDYLESAFLIRRLPRVDRDAQRFQRQVAFKVYLTSPCLYTALFGPVPATDGQLFPRLAETALVSQWMGATTASSLAYASWRTGAIDLLTLDPDSGRPSHVYEIDWTNAHARPGGKGPRQLVDFVAHTNRAARTYVLTGAVARPAAMNGIDLTLAPLALYAYWLERDPTLRAFHGAGAAAGPNAGAAAPAGAG